MNLAVSIIFIIFFLAFSVGFGVWIFKTLPQWNSIDRCFAAAIPAATFLFITSVLQQTFDAPFWDWNAARLAPTFALTHGYQLYYNADTGPILNTIYGPITALAYLPATLVKSPTSAVIIGSFISAAFFFTPILGLIINENLHQSQKVSSLNRSQKLLFTIYAFYAFVGFSLFSYNSTPLNYSAFNIHADGIALGLAGAACAFLYCRKSKDNLLSFVWSAVMIVLSIWAKQVTLPLLVALPTYVLLVDGRRCFKRYLLCICISGLIVSVLLLIIFNPQETLFNILTIPANHPWRVPGTLSDIDIITLVANSTELLGDQKLALLISAQELMKYCKIPVFTLFCGCLYQFLFMPRISNQITDWLRDNRWSMLLIVGLFMIPTSLLGRVKIGGYVNAFSFALYFLAAAATLLVFKLILDSVSINTMFSKPLTPLRFLTVVLLVTAFFNRIPTDTLTELPKLLQELPNNPQQIAYNYAKLHPNSAYFPWNPLSSLLAEGKLYHFEYGLKDRLLAGYPVSNENFMSYIPSDIQLLAFAKRNDQYIMQFLPEFSRKIEVDELPGWYVYGRE